MSESLANLAKSGEDTYSTSEVFTGQYWIDGKPIYRKVIVQPITQANTDIDISSMGVDKVLSLRGCDSNHFLPFTNAFNTSVLVYNVGLNYEFDTIKIRYGTGQTIETPIYIIIEYTKS